MLDTNMGARPESLQAVVDYLSRGTSHIQQWESGARDTAELAETSWSGKASAGAVSHVVDGADAARELAEEYTTAAEHLATLLSTLIECEAVMADARASADSAGLLVIGRKIYPPLQPAWAFGYAPGPTPHEYERLRAQSEAWESARGLAYRARRTWSNAVVRYREEAITDSVSGLLDVGGMSLETALGRVTLRVEHYKQALDAVDDMISSLSASINDLKVGGTVVGSKQHFYDLVDERGSLLRRRVSLSDSLDAAKRLGSKLTKASAILGPIGFGYGTYADMAEGESTTQALVSNGVDWGVAAMFTGGGAVLGSFVAPPVGTVVGGVVGGAIGVFAGSFGNGFVDHWFEDVSPDFQGALSSGWDEVKKTGEQVGDLVTGVWNSVF